MAEKKVYKNPVAGSPLISTISTKCMTPLLEVKFCSIVKPFYYPNSPTIPRYSITCIVDCELHKDFLKGIMTIEKNEGVDSILKNEIAKDSGEYFNTGKMTVKFQGKDKIPVFIKTGKEEEQITLEDDLAKGEKIEVIYDILRYTKKNTAKIEHGLSFKAVKIYYYPKD
jgi:hypothetical protein